ncbi:MAG: hypothetical protein EZS28_044702 [Streblomastix strix]|uniref:Uncharacterized protein n=1 Tax=Streblomastix strix TaxID=222440 RepID=A0A5J4TQR4_9EUKA|nr:MAG: hypothetical protein EZS28_044702 [Streblomastix strix]
MALSIFSQLLLINRQTTFRIVQQNLERITQNDLEEKREIHGQFVETPDMMTCVLLLSSLLNEHSGAKYKAELRLSFLNYVNLWKVRTIEYALCVYIAKSRAAKNIQCAIPVEAVKKLAGNTSGKVSTNAQILLKLIQEQ